jgi:cytochrome c oxidase subunit 3
MLWLAVAGSSLAFHFYLRYFSCAYAQGYGTSDSALPDMFWLSTLVILFSSITLHEANLAFVNERFLHYRVFLGATLATGLHVHIIAGWWLDGNDQHGHFQRH